MMLNLIACIKFKLKNISGIKQGSTNLKYKKLKHEIEEKYRSECFFVMKKICLLYFISVN